MNQLQQHFQDILIASHLTRRDTFSNLLIQYRKNDFSIDPIKELGNEETIETVVNRIKDCDLKSRFKSLGIKITQKKIQTIEEILRNNLEMVNDGNILNSVSSKVRNNIDTSKNSKPQIKDRAISHFLSTRTKESAHETKTIQKKCSKKGRESVIYPIFVYQNSLVDLYREYIAISKLQEENNQINLDNENEVIYPHMSETTFRNIIRAAGVYKQSKLYTDVCIYCGGDKQYYGEDLENHKREACIIRNIFKDDKKLLEYSKIVKIDDFKANIDIKSLTPIQASNDYYNKSSRNVFATVIVYLDSGVVKRHAFVFISDILDKTCNFALLCNQYLYKSPEFFNLLKNRTIIPTSTSIPFP